MVDAIGGFDVFRAVRFLDSTQAANTRIGQGVVPAAEPNLQFNDAFDIPTRGVLGANTEAQRIGAVPPTSRPILSDRTDFFRPFGPILTANTTTERGIALQIDPRARTEIVDEAAVRREAFATDAVEESTGFAPPSFQGAPLGSQDAQLLSRPSLLNLSGFEPPLDGSTGDGSTGDGSTGDGGQPFGFGLTPPAERPDIGDSGIGLSFDALEPLETDLGQPLTPGPTPRDPNTGAGRLPETTVARDGFVDFARLLAGDEVAASIGILPGRQDNAAERLGAFPADNNEPAPAPPPVAGGDAEVREQELGLNPTRIAEDRRNDFVTPPAAPSAADNGAIPVAPPPLNQDQEFQNELRQRFADLAPEDRESIGRRFRNPLTSIVEGGFPLIGAIFDRDA